ncbi:MAG TPA: GIY-YIG nuclease family protein [Polyangiaceae bacterium]|nr:GIY-YIG nuclease family protein [Polyangiaceae bacterium]
MAVYYIRGGPDRIKIGKADRPEQRLRDLQTGSPVELELLATEPGDRDVEHKRHRQFAGDRVQGEWFAASSELLQHIDEIKSDKPRPKPEETAPPIVRPLPTQNWPQLWEHGVWLGKTFLKALAVMVGMIMCTSALSKNPTVQEPHPVMSLPASSEVASTPPAKAPAITPVANAKRATIPKKKRVQRLELPCKPGQQPPCYD